MITIIVHCECTICILHEHKIKDVIVYKIYYIPNINNSLFKERPVSCICEKSFLSKQPYQRL